MNDNDITARVAALVRREHELRQGRQDGTISKAAESEELKAAERELDQCWDLLRQRRAKREYGNSADEAEARPASVVENYYQ